MYCTLYILRRNGRRLPPDEVRAAGIPGRFEFGPSKKVSFPRTDAWFTPADGSPELRIIHAHVKFISTEGMMVYGQDPTLQFNYAETRQAWWLVPLATGPAQG